MDHQNRPRLLFVTSAVIFGTIGLFVRAIDLASGALALCRAILAAVLIGAYLLVTKQRIAWSSIRRDVPPLLLSGMAMGVNWILLFEAYKYTTVSLATLSYYFAPVIVMAVSPILFRERLTARQIVCFVMSTLGLVLITGAGMLGSGTDIKGIAFGLGAAVFYATVMLLNKFIRGVAGVHRTFLQFLAAIVVLAPYVTLSGGIGLAGLSLKGGVMLLIVGFVHTGVTYCMYFSALKELPGQKTAILSYIDPLVAMLLSVTLLGETMTLMQLIGGTLILGFTLLCELAPEKR